MKKRSLLKRVLLFGTGSRWGTRLSLILLVIIFIELRAPAAFAFPYSQEVGRTTIYAEQPLSPEIKKVVAKADRLLQASSINTPDVRRQIVLTDGGWRWRMMALNSVGSVAVRRPFSNVLIFNRSDVGADRVSNGASIGGTRTLSRTIAHETTHLLVAHHLGEIAAMRLPVWKQEGYADYIGGETSVDPGDEQRIRAKDPDADVLKYYAGRRRVAGILAQKGGSFDALVAH